MTMETKTAEGSGPGRSAGDAVARLGLWLTFVTAVVLPAASLTWRTYERLDRVEAQVREARLPETNDRLTRIERDVDWIRKAIEAKK